MFQKCDTQVIMSIKPMLLEKMYEHCGLKVTRDMYEEFIRTPPIQLELHTTMIDIEKNQDNPNGRQIRKCFECLVQHFGSNNVKLWMDYMKFETDNGNAQLSPAIYRRALAMLKKELVDEFLKAQTLAKIN